MAPSGADIIRSVVDAAVDSVPLRDARHAALRVDRKCSRDLGRVA
jgi:hypothetical protein